MEFSTNIIDEKRGAHHPLTEIVAPHIFPPAGIRNSEMKISGTESVPQASCHQMAVGVIKGMLHQFGVFAGPGSEDQKHGFFGFGGDLSAGEFFCGIRTGFNFSVVIDPVFTGTFN